LQNDLAAAPIRTHSTALAGDRETLGLDKIPIAAAEAGWTGAIRRGESSVPHLLAGL